MMTEARFQDSTLNALLDLSPDMMIAGVVLGLMICLATAHLFALFQRWKPALNSPSVLSGVMLVPVLLAMVVCLGYERYLVDKRGAWSYRAASWSSPRPEPPRDFDWRHHHPMRFGGWGPRPITPPFFAVADVNRDGQLSPDEAAGFVESADTDGDGQVDAEAFESTVRSRTRSFAPPEPPAFNDHDHVAERPGSEPKPGS